MLRLKLVCEGPWELQHLLFRFLGSPSLDVLIFYLICLNLLNVAALLAVVLPPLISCSFSDFNHPTWVSPSYQPMQLPAYGFDAGRGRSVATIDEFAQSIGGRCKIHENRLFEV